MRVNEKETIHISKLMSLVLRHKPDAIGLVLDEHGWAYTDELMARMKAHGTAIDLGILEHVVETNNKKDLHSAKTKQKYGPARAIHWI